jgi:6-pyruvoyltetrahydropterin/6-carboxytetrahydropterin synthase
MSFTIDLQKENFKFSCTHFTIFGPTDGERMHGHNYQVRCQIEIRDIRADVGMAFDFNAVKPQIKDLCNELDERILLPETSPYLKIAKTERSVHILFHKKEYVLPAEDILSLPIANITAEELARYFCKTLKTRMAIGSPGGAFAQSELLSFAITVEETLGQSVTYKE